MKNLFNQILGFRKDQDAHVEQQLNISIDKNVSSYFEEDKYPKQSYYSFIDTDNQESLAKEFERVLGSSLKSTTSNFYAELAQTAFDLKSIREEEENELSEAVYVMF